MDQAGSPIYDSVEASLKLSIRDMFVTDDQLKFSVFAQQAEPNFLRGSSAPPDIMTRAIMTTLKVKDQETIVLGGLINKTQSVSYTGIPGLSRIPLIGKAFRNKSVNVSENELIILLTPKIDTREEDKAKNVKFEKIPVPSRNERLELLNQAFKRIQSGHTSKGEQR
jgi:type II secretory pathway component GspD/PulD (secretin)